MGFPLTNQKTPKLYKCAVGGCESNSRDDPNLAFHTFPNPQSKQASSCVYISDYFGNECKVDQLTAWLRVLRIKRHNKGMRVCSAHFKKEDYSFPVIQYSSKRPLLIKNAVPSLKLPVVDEAKDDLNKQRLKRRLRREVNNSFSRIDQSVRAAADHNYSLRMNENAVPIQEEITNQEVPTTADPRANCSGKDCSKSVSDSNIFMHEEECISDPSETVPCISLCNSEGYYIESETLQSFLKEVFQEEDIFAAHDGSDGGSDGSILLHDSPSNNENDNGENSTMDDSGVFAEPSFSYSNDSVLNVSLPNLEMYSQNPTNTSCAMTENLPRGLIATEPSASPTVSDGMGAEHTTGEKCEQTIGQKDIGLQVDYKYSILDMLKTDQQLSSTTGIESFKLLDMIVKCMKVATEHRYEKKTVIMDTRKRVIMTYVKLKHNISFRFLSLIFGNIVSEQHCGRIFVQTVLMLSKIMKAIALPWPSRQTIRKNLPQCFKGFEHTRVVLDCTEVHIQRPQNLCCRIQVFSQYKGGETIKVMTGVTPGGNMAYISKPYGGRHSDTSIFGQSDLVQLLEPGDGVMVDKGFLIDKVCEMKKLCLIRPPLLRKKNNKRKFTAKESILCKSIAKARVHVERFNQRIKVFDMLGGVYPISLVPIIGEVFNVVCGTVNLSSPILDDDKFMASKS